VAADLDRDGRIDLWFGGASEAPRLLRNQLDSGHTVAVRLRGATSNREGIGARVTAVVGGRRVTQEMLASGAAFGGREHRLVFGLGAAAAADEILVRWPSGYAQWTGPVAAGTEVEIVEPALLRVEPAICAPGDEVHVLAHVSRGDGAPLGGGHRVDLQVDGEPDARPMRETDGAWSVTLRASTTGVVGFTLLIDGQALLARPTILVR
jgi:hypothetical protein